MSLIEIIAGVEAREPTLTVFNADPDVTETLRGYFAERNVQITAAQTDAGPAGYAVFSRNGSFVTAVDVDELLPDRNAGLPTRGDGLGPPDDDRIGGPILDHLDETLFTSYSRGDMVAASKEIEDRAWRVGDGALHAGFQTLDVLRREAETYDLLGEKSGLNVHAYAAAGEETPPDADHYAVHTGRTAELRETWFVAYDGDGRDGAKCALLAEERAPTEFYGFWSYDPEMVDEIIGYLTGRYGTAAEADAGEAGERSGADEDG